MAVKQIKTCCRLCISHCGIVVDVDDDRVVRVLGDEDHPVTRGYTCSKGRALTKQHHDPRRLEQPQMRTNGALADAAWEDVLGDLGGKLRKIVEESGPGAIGFFLGGGCYVDAAAYVGHRTAVQALGTPSYYSDVTVDAISKY